MSGAFSPPRPIGVPSIPAIPYWRGEDLDGKTIVLLTEQGFGDSIQFIRYAPLLARCGARVVVICEWPLARLFAQIEGVLQVYHCGNIASVVADYQCRLLSLPGLCGTTLESIPNGTPYLKAGRIPLSETSGNRRRAGRLRVGLVWAGRKRLGTDEKTDRRRSFPISLYAPLLTVPDVQFFSLQKDQPIPASPSLECVVPFPPEARDFFDTSRLIASLDLIISVDTSVAHLAGGMGLPVWMLSRFDGCWRWLQGRIDSPWYPTMRIFHQPSSGDWDSVISVVRESLMALAASCAGRGDAALAVERGLVPVSDAPQGAPDAPIRSLFCERSAQ